MTSVDEPDGSVRPDAREATSVAGSIGTADGAGVIGSAGTIGGAGIIGSAGRSRAPA